MAVCTYFIAFPEGVYGSFEPNYLSVNYSITPNGYPVNNLGLTWVKEITYEGNTWDIYQATVNNSNYEGGNMSTYNAWFHDEDNSTNRTGYDNFYDVQSVVDVYVLSEIYYDARALDSSLPVTTDNVICFFTYSDTYEPEASNDNVWNRSGKSMEYGFTYHITVTAHSQWILETIPVQANYEYNINATVQSEKNWDGIVITTGQHSAPTGNFSNTSGIGGWSDVVLALTSSSNGTSTTSSTTYTATSNGNLYLYFRTDGSGLYPSTGEIGEVGIIGHSAITITLNDNGGSGGSGTKTVTSGTVSGNIGSVNVPTRGSFTFGGYYNIVAYTGGLQYISSSGSGTGGYSITSAITLYARWTNTINWSPSTSVSCSYSSSQQDVTIASTAATCASSGTVSYSITSITKSGTTQSTTGWGINGTTLHIPSSQATGTYTIVVGTTSPNSGSTTSSTYAAGSLTKVITLTISTGNITITLDRNGGTTGDTSFSVAPGASVSNYPSITMPTRGTFRFDGYYTSRTGGDEKINASGTPQAAAPTSATTWYAHWYNTVSYSPTGGSATYSANSQNVTVSSTAGSCASGGTVTYDLDDVKLNGSSIDYSSGWSISSDGKTMTIPAALAAGTYSITILAQSTGTTSGTSTYFGDDTFVTFNIVVSSPSNITISLNKNGGSGGTTAVSVTPGAAAGTWSVATPPTRTGFTFMGYYSVSAATGGTKYVDVDGTSVYAAPSSSSTIYARWMINLTWPCYVYDDFTTLSIYCTDKAECASTPSTRRDLKISGSGISCKVQPTVTILSVFRGNASDYSVSSGGTFLYIPAGTTAGNNYAQVKAEVSNGTYNSYPYVGNSISAFIIRFTMNAVTLSSISVSTRDNSIRVDGSTTINAIAFYTNGKSKEVGSQSTITFGTSGIASANKNIALYIDDYPSDRETWAMENDYYAPDWYNWCYTYIMGVNCPEDVGVNKYYYTGETISYSGNTYYLWKHVQQSYEVDLNVTYVLTSTIDYTTLYGLSQEYDPDTDNYPIVARLNYDQTTYDNAGDQLLLKVDQGS